MFILLMLDAYSHRYINKKFSPKLNELFDEKHSILIPPAGYEGFIDLFSREKNIKEKRKFLFVKSKNSPFKKVPNFILAFLDKLPAQQYVRAIIVRILKLFPKFRDNSLYTYKIPWLKLKTMWYSDAKPIYEQELNENIFEKFKKQNIDFNWYAAPNRKKDNEVLDLILKSEKQFCFGHLTELDGISHKYGPFGSESLEKVKKIDEGVRHFIEELSRKKDAKIDLVVFSDHGMSEVNDYIDIKSILGDSDKEYDYFIDSTAVRFFNLANSEMKINHLMNIPNTTLVKSNYTNVGEYILYANNGAIFKPNYFEGKQELLGMHGYENKRDSAFMAHIKIVNGNIETSKLKKSEILWFEIIDYIEELNGF